MSIAIQRASAPHEIERCLAIRRTVFIKEQGVDAALEVDGLDGEALHYLGRLGAVPVATARVRLLREGDARVAKVQRVAVLPEARGTGAGAAIMRHLMHDVERTHGVASFTLGSQESAVPFYERLGYRIVGERFMDAGIPHRTMVFP